MKRSLLYIGSVLVLLVFCISCEQKIELPLDEHEGKLVVQCILEPEVPPQIFITKSRALLGFSAVNTVEFVTDAIVTITVDGQEHALAMESGFEDYSSFSDSDSYWNYEGDSLRLFYYINHDLAIVHGKTYELNVSHDGAQIYAQTTVPDPAPIDHVRLDSTEVSYEWGQSYIDEILVVEFTDIPDQENFYVIDTQLEETVPVFESIYDPVTGEWIGEEVVDTVTEQRNSVKWWSLLSDRSLDGSTLSMNFYPPSQSSFWQYPIPETDTISIRLRLRTVDPDLGKFYESLDDQEWTEGDPSVEPVRIWSNIEGGLGIFGSLGISEPVYFDHIIYND